MSVKDVTPRTMILMSCIPQISHLNVFSSKNTQSKFVSVHSLKDLHHGLRVQTGREILMTSRKVVNIVIKSEREANADLLCGSS